MRKSMVAGGALAACAALGLAGAAQAAPTQSFGMTCAQAQAKRFVSLCADHAIDASLIHETARLLSERRASAEGVAGLSGFLEKRPPDWRELRKRAHVP